MKQIPKISRDPKNHNKAHIFNILIGCSVGILFGASVYFSSAFGFERALYFGLAGAVISTLVIYVLEQNEHQETSYINMLKNYDLEQLVQLSKIQELNDAERGLVVKYLNENHPGWSISMSVPV